MSRKFIISLDRGFRRFIPDMKEKKISYLEKSVE